MQFALGLYAHGTQDLVPQCFQDGATSLCRTRGTGARSCGSGRRRSHRVIAGLSSRVFRSKDASPALRAKFAGAFAAGHIAFLASYRSSGGTVSVTLRGTNQPPPTVSGPTDHSCFNGSLWSFSYSNSSGIRYYRR